MVTAITTVGALVALGVILTWPVQSAMARLQIFRHEPGWALFVWQCVSLAAVIALLAPGVVTIVLLRDRLDSPLHLAVAAAALVITGWMIARLVIAGHRVGHGLRTSRRAQRDVIDLVSRSGPHGTRLLEHPTPTAYCVPGLRHRVVLSTGTVSALTDDELRGVLAHERAHVRSRHDLLVEFFTVLHMAMPEPLRHPDALDEVRLLAEVLADRAGARVVGAPTLGRALVTLAEGPQPVGVMPVTSGHEVARIRLNLLNRDRRNVSGWLMLGAMIGYAVMVVSLPLAVVALTVRR